MTSTVLTNRESCSNVQLCAQTEWARVFLGRKYCASICKDHSLSKTLIVFEKFIKLNRFEKFLRLVGS